MLAVWNLYNLYELYDLYYLYDLYHLYQLYDLYEPHNLYMICTICMIYMVCMICMTRLLSTCFPGGICMAQLPLATAHTYVHTIWMSCVRAAADRDLPGVYRLVVHAYLRHKLSPLQVLGLLVSQRFTAFHFLQHLTNGVLHHSLALSSAHEGTARPLRHPLVLHALPESDLLAQGQIIMVGL